MRGTGSSICLKNWASGQLRTPFDPSSSFTCVVCLFASHAELTPSVATNGNLCNSNSCTWQGASQTWEHPAALPEGLSDRAEAQDDVQVGAHTLQEEGVQGLPSLRSPFLLSSRPHLIQHPCQLILGEQVGHFTCVSTHHRNQVLHMPELRVTSAVSPAAQSGCYQLLERRMQGFQGLKPNHSMLNFGHG